MQKKNLQLVTDSIGVYNFEVGIVVQHIESPFLRFGVSHNLPDGGGMSRGNDETHTFDGFGGPRGTVDKETCADDVAVSICLSELVKVAGYICVAIEKLQPGQSPVDCVFKRCYIKWKFRFNDVCKWLWKNNVVNL